MHATPDLIFSLILGANALPIDFSASRVNRFPPGGGPGANPGSIYLCQSADWAGDCAYLNHPLVGDKNGPPCIAIPDAWQQITSIGGDEGPACFSYSEDGCTGVAMDITYPGIPNVKKIVQWRDWRGQARSYRCQFEYNPVVPPP